MAMRPRGREKNITGAGKNIFRRGSGMGTGPVGNAGGYGGRGGSTGGGQKRSGGGGSSLLKIILALVVLLGGGGAGLSGLFGGGSTTTPTQDYAQYASPLQMSSMFSGFSQTSSGWDAGNNTGKLDKSVASGARSKYTKILGNGKDTVTVLVYMCGTDLESGSGMGTSDLQEMANATLGKNVNLLVYTGGCKRWQNSIVSSSTNQIYKVEGDGGLRCLEKDLGSKVMTDPATLTSFIKYGVKNYPANRVSLIFWDHGGGSLSGYGYDEKYASAGSMTLKGISEALENAGTKFDFIGFDACLMATLENALMLAPYGDYLIASEETEPGVGWYYTNWLTELSKNTSLSTLEVGKKIADDFVDVCAQQCRGQKTTLSVVDLAELSATAPESLTDFSTSTAKLVQSEFKTVSGARSGAREFASSNKIDQVDLVHLASNLGTAEGEELVDTLLSAVKYNRTSTNMTNAYGLSIYFPYQKVSKVNSAVAAYEDIGMDDEYARCIQQFASMEVGGQAVSGGASSPLAALSGAGYSGGGADAQAILQILGGLMGGNPYNVAGLSGGSGFFGRSLDMDGAAAYLSENQFDARSLVWTSGSDGTPELRLSEQQWALVQNLELNVFFDDGAGYIDLGLDNVFDFTENGALLGTYDGTWLAIDDQPVAYYHTDTVDDGTNYTISGRVPVLLNGSRADLILVFDNEHPYGFVAGARSDYRGGETETIAKELTGLREGDRIDFLCDYYSYDGSYQDSYMLGEQMICDGELTISNVYIDADAAQPAYRFTDIYNQQYWTPVLPFIGK